MRLLFQALQKKGFGRNFPILLARSRLDRGSPLIQYFRRALVTTSPIELLRGTQSLLDAFYRARRDRRLRAPVLVGCGRHNSDNIRQLVGRIPQRLVLIVGAASLPTGI
jgi:hypothetical protein